MAEPAWTPEFVCGTAAPIRDGIYRFLRPERAAGNEAFLRQYRRVRDAEGYRQRQPAYYQALPDVDRRDPQAARWRVRQKTFRNLGRVLRRFGGGPLRILDLGAGSGWLAARLTELGHSCVAVDWLDDEEDGLGAARYYRVGFTCVQADFDDLPMAPRQFDVAIFNASLHYSYDPARTLRHARDTLVPGGMLVVMDSPVFDSDGAGRRMLDAQQVDFHATCRKAVRWGVGFLTETSLTGAARQAGLEVRWIPTRGGPSWALRRRWAGLKQRRAPARFGLWFGVWQPASS